MPTRVLPLLILLIAGGAAWPVDVWAQGDAPTVARPQAISGDSASGRNCISGNAANVHAIGWVATNTEYTVTFESSMPLAAAAARFDLAANQTSVNYGTPAIARTAGSNGTMALFVASAGDSGCYRYKTEIRVPSSLNAPEAAGSFQSDDVPEAPAGLLSIAGIASSATHCISGSNSVANVHEVGRIEEGNSVVLTFSTDFNAVAGAMLVDVPAQKHTAWRDDNSGGGVEPRISFTAPHAGTLALYVGGVSGAAGCYRYKVEIR